MKREFLEGLGLDKEKIDSIMAEHGKTVESHKTKAADLQTNLDNVNKQLKDRDVQLEELKKVDAKGMQAKIDELQKANESTKTEYELKLKDTQLSSALKLALTGKVHDADLVQGLIDKTKIELGEDGNVIKGLDEQIKELQTSKSFLFVPEKKEQNLKGWVPNNTAIGDDEPINIGSDFAKMANEKGTSNNNENNPWG